MLCDQCGERQAAIHLTQIVNNAVTTQHLCEVCASEKGVHTETSVTKHPLGDFLASMGKGAAAALPPTTESTPCDFCGATLQDFRDTGRLGCPHCYESFAPHLRTLLRRIHGASRHVGHVYLSPEGGEEIPERAPHLEALRAQLRRAIEAENFELAAELRDQIRGME